MAPPKLRWHSGQYSHSHSHAVLQCRQFNGNSYCCITLAITGRWPKSGQGWSRNVRHRSGAWHGYPHGYRQAIAGRISGGRESARDGAIASIVAIAYSSLPIIDEQMTERNGVSNRGRRGVERSFQYQTAGDQMTKRRFASTGSRGRCSVNALPAIATVRLDDEATDRDHQHAGTVNWITLAITGRWPKSGQGWSSNARHRSGAWHGYPSKDRQAIAGRISGGRESARDGAIAGAATIA